MFTKLVAILLIFIELVSIKENIELANLDECYNVIKNLNLKRYKWKDNIFNENHPLFNESEDLYNRTVGFINGGHITTHEEIRRFVHSAYSDLVYGVFELWEMGGATNQEILVDTYNFINPRR